MKPRLAMAVLVALALVVLLVSPVRRYRGGTAAAAVALSAAGWYARRRWLW